MSCDDTNSDLRLSVFWCAHVRSGGRPMSASASLARQRSHAATEPLPDDEDGALSTAPTIPGSVADSDGGESPHGTIPAWKSPRSRADSPSGKLQVALPGLPAALQSLHGPSVLSQSRGLSPQGITIPASPIDGDAKDPKSPFMMVPSKMLDEGSAHGGSSRGHAAGSGEGEGAQRGSMTFGNTRSSISRGILKTGDRPGSALRIKARVSVSVSSHGWLRACIPPPFATRMYHACVSLQPVPHCSTRECRLV